MASGIPDSLERLTHADLIGVVRELIGEVGRLRAENEKLGSAFAELKTEHQAVKDELARLKNLPRRPPQKPSGMDAAIALPVTLRTLSPELAFPPNKANKSRITLGINLAVTIQRRAESGRPSDDQTLLGPFPGPIYANLFQAD